MAVLNRIFGSSGAVGGEVPKNLKNVLFQCSERSILGVHQNYEGGYEVMKKKFILQVVAWLLTIAMLLPSAGAAITEVYAAESKAAYSGSVTFSDSSWWTEKEASQTDLLGNIDPQDVSYIRFYSDTTFNIGYSGVNGDWVIGEAQTSYDVSDIRWTDMLFKFGLSKNDGVMYTIKWDVYTGDAKPAEEKKDDAKGTEFTITTTSTDFGGTSKIPVSAFKNCTGGAKIVVEFTQETADWWNLALHSDGTEWHNLSEYITNVKSNSYGYIDSFSAGDTSITVELSQEGVDKILADGGGLLFQVKAMKVTKATVVPVTAKADPTATPTPTATPKPTATPTPTPIIQYTKGDVLTLTQDMVNKDGIATLENGIYNKIIIPADIDASKIVLNRMFADLLVVEGGVERTVVLLDGEIDKVVLENANVEEVDYKKLVEDGMELEEALKLYSEYLDTAKAAEKAQVTFRTGTNAKIKTLETLGNASLDLTQGKVNELNISTENRKDNMSVSVKGHTGNLFVTMEKKQFNGNGNLKLTLNNCEMDDVVISGGAVSLGLDGMTASANTVIVENTGNVSLNMNATDLVVSEKTTDAEIRIYGKVGTATVEGDKNSIILPSCGKIENAVVNGDKVRVYGLGTVNNAVVNGTGANVATLGTAVEGENDTTMPQGMINMMPTAKPTQIPKTTVEVTLDSSYPGDWSKGAGIPNSALKNFSGDIAFDLEYVCVNDENAQFAFIRSDWSKVPNSKSAEFVGVDNKANTITVVITKENLATVQGTLDLQVNNMYLTKATLRNATLEDFYTGDYSEGYTIEVSELAGYTGDVKVEVKYTQLSSKDGYAMTCVKVGHDWSWTKLESDDYANIEYALNSWGMMELPKGTSSTTFVLSAATVKDIAANYKKLIFQINGILVDEVTLSAVTTSGGESGSGSEGGTPAPTVAPTATPEPTTTPTPGGSTGTSIHTFTYDEYTEIKAGNPNGAPEYEIKLYDYYKGTLEAGDKVKVSVTLSSDVDYNANIGASVYSATKEDGEWNNIIQGSGKITAEYEVAHGKNWVNAFVQIWYMGETENGVKVEAITVEKVTDTSAGEGSGSAGGTTTQVATSGALKLSSSNWWSTKKVDINDLIGDIDPATVSHVVFKGEVDFIVGYGNVNGDSTTNIGESYYNAYFTQTSAAKEHTLEYTEMAFTSFQDADGNWHGYTCEIALSRNDGIEYTFEWDVYVKQ